MLMSADVHDRARRNPALCHQIII